MAVELVLVGDAGEGLDGVEDGHVRLRRPSGGIGMTHGRQHLNLGLRLGGQGVLHPLAIVVEDAIESAGCDARSGHA